MFNSATNKRKIDKFGNTPNQIVFIICMIALPLLGFLVFTVYANLGGFVLSFMQNKNGVEYFCGFDNYARFFKGFKVEQYDKTILLSLKWLLIVGLINLPISLFTAFVLAKKIPFAKIIVVCLYLPNIIPAALLAEFYRRLWDSGGGVVQSGLLYTLVNSITHQDINWLVSAEFANRALWIYTVIFGFGFNAIILWGAFSKVPQEVIESAKLDGANVFREFFSIDIPIIWPTLTMVIILTLMVPSQIYMQPLLLANNGHYGTRTLALLIMQELKNYNPYYSSAISVLIAIVMLPLILVVKKLLDKAFTTVEI